MSHNLSVLLLGFLVCILLTCSTCVSLAAPSVEVRRVSPIVVEDSRACVVANELPAQEGGVH